MPKLKKKITADFTVIHNKMIRDYNLGSTERGLLLTMLSLPDDWNFSIKGLSKILPDGVTKISTALKNLEKYKYLIRKRIYCNGKISDWEYIFSDEPMEEQDIPHSVVEAQFMKLKQEHLAYVLKRLMLSTTKITNPTAYLLTTIYNSVLTCQFMENTDLKAIDPALFIPEEFHTESFKDRFYGHTSFRPKKAV